MKTYNQEYLNNLKGLSVETATQKVYHELGMNCQPYAVGSILCAIARDCVLLFIDKHGIVNSAHAGDPSKLKS